MQHPQPTITEFAHPIAEQQYVRDGPPPRAQHKDPRRVLAANIALGWAVTFLAFHIYWYLGGSFVSPGKLPGWPHTVAGWIVEVLADGVWALGLLVPLSISRGWARGRLAKPVATLVWLGCVILTLRGATGLIDDLTRVTGALPNGLSGISTKDATGTTTVTWAMWAIETYFLIGGLVFGALAITGSQAEATRNSEVSMNSRHIATALAAMRRCELSAEASRARLLREAAPHDGAVIAGAGTRRLVRRREGVEQAKTGLAVDVPSSPRSPTAEEAAGVDDERPAVVDRSCADD
jgi:hypothetical protein